LSSASLDSALQKIGRNCAELVHNGDLVGLGSGSTVAKFAIELGKRVRSESLKVSVVPSSTQAWILANDNGIPVAQDSAHCPPKLDLAFDGADQISVATRSMIKGGGGALLKEKIILSCSQKNYILADYNKYVLELDKSVPVEVIQFSVSSAEEKLKQNFPCIPTLRKLDKGYPFFTESGNLILDCQFKMPMTDALSLERRIKIIPGVVEAGLFNCRVEKFYKATPDGSFETA
jgi:ribose 5-phosphate isomerase A